jgi:hypothetical protein
MRVSRRLGAGSALLLSACTVGAMSTIWRLRRGGSWSYEAQNSAAFWSKPDGRRMKWIHCRPRTLVKRRIDSLKECLPDGVLQGAEF